MYVKNDSLTDMQETEKLFWQDPYRKEQDVTIVDLVQSPHTISAIVDRTICYPESGGQPGDTGFLGSTRIIDTQYGEDKTILHVLGEGPVPVIGKTYRMKLDWDHRYDYMQQHSAQHLISGILYANYNIGTLSVHFGANEFTIEIDANDLPEETLLSLEDTVNKAIRMNCPIAAEIYSLEDARHMALRRAIKVDSDVRLVKIESYDVIACGGVHVASTGELMLVMCIGTEKIRGHIRTQWIAGDRAVQTYRLNHALIKQLSATFSTPPQELVQSASNLQQQLSDIQFQLRRCHTMIASMKLKTAIEHSQYIEETPVVIMDASAEDAEFSKRLTEAVNEIDTIALCVVQEREDEKLAWMIVLKGPKASTIQFSEVKEQLLPIIAAKGGGRPPLWQGVGANVTAKDIFLNRFIAFVRQGFISGHEKT